MSYGSVFKYFETRKNIEEPPMHLHLNPLTTHAMAGHFKKLCKNSDKLEQIKPLYRYTHSEMIQQLELRQLFDKFDEDRSGTLDLDELSTMFQTAGIKVTVSQLKDVFKAAKDVRIVQGGLTLEEFCKLMMSKEIDQAFKDFLEKIRESMNRLDYGSVQKSVNYLPSDLSLMLGYLYRRSIRYKLNTNIKANTIENTNQMTKKDWIKQVEQDMGTFTEMFKSDEIGDSFVEPLRKKYTMKNLEKRFRKDQDPQNKKREERMRYLTVYFLNRLKLKAFENKNLRALFNDSLNAKSMSIPILREGQSIMTSKEDKKALNLQNLTTFGQDNESHDEEEEEAKKSVKVVTEKEKIQKIIENLAIIKQQNLPFKLSKKVTFNSHEDLQGFNKNDQSLFDLFSALNENLQYLDEIKDIFEQGSNQREQSLASTIQNSKNWESLNKPTDTEDQQNQKLDVTPQLDPNYIQVEFKASQNTFKPVTTSSDTKESFDSKQRFRNGHALFLHKKQKHTHLRVQDNDSESLKDSRANDYLSTENDYVPAKNYNDDQEPEGKEEKLLYPLNPFMDPKQLQMHLQGQKVLTDILKQNQNNNLSDFQKSHLKNLKNTSKRSKMIVFGDCVSQLENVVERNRPLRHRHSSIFTQSRQKQQMQQVSGLDSNNNSLRDRSQMYISPNSTFLDQELGNQTILFVPQKGQKFSHKVRKHSAQKSREHKQDSQQFYTHTMNTPSLSADFEAENTFQSQNFQRTFENKELTSKRLGLGSFVNKKKKVDYSKVAKYSKLQREGQAKDEKKKSTQSSAASITIQIDGYGPGERSNTNESDPLDQVIYTSIGEDTVHKIPNASLDTRNDISSTTLHEIQGPKPTGKPNHPQERSNNLESVSLTMPDQIKISQDVHLLIIAQKDANGKTNLMGCEISPSPSDSQVMSLKSLTNFPNDGDATAIGENNKYISPLGNFNRDLAADFNQHQLQNLKVIQLQSNNARNNDSQLLATSNFKPEHATEKLQSHQIPGETRRRMKYKLKQTREVQKPISLAQAEFNFDSHLDKSAELTFHREKQKKQVAFLQGFKPVTESGTEVRTSQKTSLLATQVQFRMRSPSKNGLLTFSSPNDKKTKVVLPQAKISKDLFDPHALKNSDKFIKNSWRVSQSTGLGLSGVNTLKALKILNNEERPKNYDYFNNRELNEWNNPKTLDNLEKKRRKVLYASMPNSDVFTELKKDQERNALNLASNIASSQNNSTSSPFRHRNKHLKQMQTNSQTDQRTQTLGFFSLNKQENVRDQKLNLPNLSVVGDPLNMSIPIKQSQKRVQRQTGAQNLGQDYISQTNNFRVPKSSLSLNSAKSLEESDVQSLEPKFQSIKSKLPNIYDGIIDKNFQLTSPVSSQEVSIYQGNLRGNFIPAQFIPNQTNSPTGNHHLLQQKKQFMQMELNSHTRTKNYHEDQDRGTRSMERDFSIGIDITPSNLISQNKPAMTQHYPSQNLKLPQNNANNQPQTASVQHLHTSSTQKITNNNSQKPNSSTHLRAASKAEIIETANSFKNLQSHQSTDRYKKKEETSQVTQQQSHDGDDGHGVVADDVINNDKNYGNVM